MTLGIPQIIMLAILFINLGIAVSRHGEVHEEKYNAGIYFISTCITLALLWWGGFFG